MAQENPTLAAAPALAATLEPFAGHGEPVTPRTPAKSAVLDDLRELVAALERRVPRLEHEGERAIARDAEALKADALRRIVALEQAPLGD
jgi:hypothetical protein